MDQLATVTERILWLEKHHFGGRRKFARKIQCSHVTISHLAAGRNQPSEALIQKIINNLGVRSEWLLDGEAPVFSHPNSTTGEDPRLIPIARQLLPGPPAEHRQLLGPTAFPVEWPIYTPDLYAIQVKDCVAAFRPSSEHLKSEDLLFVASSENTPVRESALIVCRSPAGLALMRTKDLDSASKEATRAASLKKYGRPPKRADFSGPQPKKFATRHSPSDTRRSEIVGIVVQLVRAF